MTVSSSTNRASYSGNGSLTTFAYSFKIFDQDDLTVILRASDGIETVQTITTNYTVTGVGDVGGGNVVFGTAPAAGVTVVILREMDLEQGLDLVPNDPFPAQSLENSLDKLTFMVQQHKEELGRTIKASRTNVLSGSEFVISAADRANKVFSFDGSGDLAITQELGTFKGNWAASTVYKVRDLVKDTSTNNIFMVKTAHTSSGSQPITTNTDAAKWDLIVDAAAAATSATAAAASETAAETAETNAETAQAASETARDASVVAKNASVTAQGASETAQAASETAQAAAEAVYDTFDDRYLGAKSTSGGDPTVDNDGNALIDGALFFDTTNNVTKVYNLGTTSWLRTTPTSAEQTNIDVLAASAVVADMAILGTTDVVNDMNILATADVVTDMNVLATADVVTDMNVLATADVVNDMNVLGTSATVTAMNLLGTSAVVTDMSILGTADVVNDMNVLGTSANVTAMNLLGTSAVVTDMSILGTADVVTDMNVLGTTANVTAMNVLGTSANVTAMSTVSGISADVTAVAADATDIGTVATDISGSNNIGTVAGSISNVNNVGGSITNVNTVASNLASVNSFGETYRIAASDPTTSLNEGDLYFDTTNNVMKVYDGSAWVAAYASLSGALAVVNNLSDLSSASAALTNLGIPGVEANADVTDTANVTAAGALMDSEVTNLAQVKAFDSSDYAPAAGSSSIVTTGALSSGSITSGFGAIDVGASAISTTGVVTAGEVTMTTLDIGGTNVTASAAELNYNDITTLGTSQASKVVTSDANNVVTFSGGIVEDSVTITSSSGTATLDMRLGTNFIHDLTEDVTYTFSNAASSGNVSSFSLKIIQGATPRLITWPTSVDWVAATAPTLTTDDNAVDIFVFQTMDGTTWYGFVAGQALG